MSYYYRDESRQDEPRALPDVWVTELTAREVAASRDIRHGHSDRIVHCEVNWESALTCEDCGKAIEAAYDVVEEGK
jgi:hypothetical protein